VYDPIQVQLNVLQSPLPAATTLVLMDEPGTAPPQEKRHPPFVIELQTFAFNVATFAEA
jgi:hypothetical protein